MPIIHDVTSKTLSSSNITVNIAFLTNGGQSVTRIAVRMTYSNTDISCIILFQSQFQISVNGMTVLDNSTVSNNMVSIDVGNLNLTKGTDYEVSVTATNSIGTSEPVTETLSVPSECVPGSMQCIVLM